MATVYDELSEARRLVDAGRRLLWRICDRAGIDVEDMLVGTDPALHEVLERLDDACGVTCPRTRENPSCSKIPCGLELRSEMGENAK